MLASEVLEVVHDSRIEQLFWLGGITQFGGVAESDGT